jgi:hypothetical protein
LMYSNSGSDINNRHYFRELKISNNVEVYVP